jgi:hypothetical protein
MIDTTDAIAGTIILVYAIYFGGTIAWLCRRSRNEAERQAAKHSEIAPAERRPGTKIITLCGPTAGAASRSTMRDDEYAGVRRPRASIDQQVRRLDRRPRFNGMIEICGSDAAG